MVQVEGETVAEAMESLIEQHPDLRQHLFNGKDELRPFVNLYLNSEDIRHLQKLATPIQDEDHLKLDGLKVKVKEPAEDEHAVAKSQ